MSTRKALCQSCQSIALSRPDVRAQSSRYPDTHRKKGEAKKGEAVYVAEVQVFYAIHSSTLSPLELPLAFWDSRVFSSISDV